MAKITTVYDAKINVTVAKQALAKGKKEGASAKDIKALEKHVNDAKAILKGIENALNSTKK